MQWFRVVFDLRDFLGKGAKTLEPQRKIPLFAAHNPEVVGSSPASATKELLKSKDFGSSSFLSGSKSWEFFRQTSPDPYRDPYQKMSNRITSPWDRPPTTPGRFCFLCFVSYRLGVCCDAVRCDILILLFRQLYIQETQESIVVALQR